MINSQIDLLSSKTIGLAWTKKVITEWEFDFYGSIYDYTVLSEKQIAVIKRIHDKVLAGIAPRYISLEPDPTTFGENPFNTPEQPIMKIVKDDRVLPTPNLRKAVG